MNPCIKSFKEDMERCIKDPFEHEVNCHGALILKNGKRINPSVLESVSKRHFVSFAKEMEEQIDIFFSQVDVEATHANLFSCEERDENDCWVHYNKSMMLYRALQGFEDAFKDKYPVLDPFRE